MTLSNWGSFINDVVSKWAFFDPFLHLSSILWQETYLLNNFLRSPLPPPLETTTVMNDPLRKNYKSAKHIYAYLLISHVLSRPIWVHKIGPHQLITRTTDAQWSLFSWKFQTFGLGQTNWADEFWGIWGIFGRTILVLWVSCPCFPLFNHYFYKKLSLSIHIPNI